MHRRPFYEIKPESYLFAGIARRESDQKQKEEPVRQWCAFELIRAYGFPITDLCFEYPVRIGSKKYEIDILILRNGSPWAVIECKEPGDQRHEKALEQAISYANAQTIKAEFVLVTNGREWLCQRRVQNQWTSIVDLPRTHTIDGRNSILEVLRTFDDTLALLYVLDRPLEGKEGRKFLLLLQIFFNGKNLLTQGTNDSVLFAIDNFLRVISEKDTHPQYQREKLRAACLHFERFRRSTGVGFEIDLECTDFPPFEVLRRLRYSVGELASAKRNLSGSTPLALRLAAALLTVGETAFRAQNPVLRITPPVHHALRDFLSYGLAIYLDLCLPDPIDEATVSDLRHFCSAAWEDFREVDY